MLKDLATLAGHHLAHRLLPLVLRWRRRRASGWNRLLLDYRLHFLHQRQAWPRGVDYRLVHASWLAPDVRALQLAAPPGVVHHPGQTLLLHWQNDEAEVQAWLQRLGAAAEQPVRLRSASSAFDPGRLVRSTLAAALRAHLDLRAAEALPAPASVQAALAHWPRTEPRSYSITGVDRRPDGDRVEILVSRVRLENGREGPCSGWLLRLQPGPPGAPGTPALRGWPLDFPLRIEPAAAAPLLVVATGIAVAGPLFELAASRRPLWLVCGLRDADPGLPLPQRLLAFAADHPQARIDVALSRAPGWQARAPLPLQPLPANVHVSGHCRVQQVLQGHRARLLAHHQAGGDTVVTGHTSMGAAVQTTLREAWQAAGLVADAAAALQLQQQLEDSLRLQYALSGR